MSENDKDPQQGEFRDPTASPDWTAPATGQPTEQIPQQSGQNQPDESPAPEAPQFDAPAAPEPPPAPADPYAGSSAQPTSPYEAAPPPPPAGPYGAGNDPYAADPYAAQQPAYDPYAATGGQAQQGGYPAYVPPNQWQAPPPAYGAPPPQNTSAIVLTILSGLGLISCCQVFMIGSLILGIMGLSKNNDDPEGAKRLTKMGWIVFGVSIALSILLVIGFFALGAAGVFDSTSSYDYDTY